MGGQKLICCGRRTKICNAIRATRNAVKVGEGQAGNAGVIINFVILSVCDCCRGLFVSCKQNSDFTASTVHTANCQNGKRIYELFNKRFKGGSVTD